MKPENVAIVLALSCLWSGVLWGPSPRLWWGALPAVAWGAAVMSEAWSVVSWWRRGRESTLPVAAALILTGIDLATIAELGAGADAWWLVQISGWISWGLVLLIGLLLIKRQWRGR